MKAILDKQACTVKIQSSGNGWKDTRKVEGTLSAEGNVFAIDYTLDGDDCRFVFSGTEAFQTRSGSLEIQMRFCEGRQTQCVLATMQGTGGYSLFTKKINTQLTDRGVTVELVYLSGTDKEKITLRLTATIES